MSFALQSTAASLAVMPLWVTGGLIALLVGICLLLILTVLIQRPSGGGLSGAFGGGGGSGQTAFGAKTGDALTWATVIMFALFLTFAGVLNITMADDAPQTQPTAEGTDTSGASVPNIDLPETNSETNPGTAPDTTGNTPETTNDPGATGETDTGDPTVDPNNAAPANVPETPSLDPGQPTIDPSADPTTPPATQPSSNPQPDPTNTPTEPPATPPGDPTGGGDMRP